MHKKAGKKLVLARESVLMIAQAVSNPQLLRVQAGISQNSGGECTCGISSCGHC